VLISALHLAQIVQPGPAAQLAQRLVLLVQAVLQRQVLQLPVVPLALLVQAAAPQRLALLLPVVPQVLLVQSALLLPSVPLVRLVLLENWQIPLAIAVLD
jgi:hypothetical protein